MNENMFDLFRRLFKISLFIVMFSVVFDGDSLSQNNSNVMEKIDVDNIYTPSGWMGDGEYGRKYIEFDGAYSIKPHSEPNCIRIKYTFGVII